MDNKRFIIILLVIFASLGGVLFFQKKTASDGSSGDTAGTKQSNNIYGKADSPVVLTEFVDFQCEACYSYYPLVKQVKEQYKDKVRFEVRNFPITSGHQFAFIAARNAEAAGKQGKYWEMHDQIFEGQKSWERTQDPQPTFDTYAKTIGLDMAKFKTDRDSSDVAGMINKDLDDVKKLGGTGTPTFLLNGQKIENPKTAEEMTKILDDALVKAGLEPGASSPEAGNGQTSPTGMPSTPTGPQPSGGNGGLSPGESPEDHAKEQQQSSGQ